MSHETVVARRQVEITNRLGLRLRAADQFVRLARRFQCEIRVHYQGAECNGKSILDLTTLAAECGARLDLEACGPDAVAAVEALAVVVAARFYENENEREHSRVMSDPSQAIVVTGEFAFHSVHALAVHHRDFLKGPVRIAISPSRASRPHRGGLRPWSSPPRP